MLPANCNPVRMNERSHGQSSITALRSLYYLVKVSLALVLLPPRTGRPRRKLA